jgi:hypothetical protein
MIVLYISGSIASILGFAVSVYVLYREIAISKEVHILKGEEEAWHKNKVGL